MSSMILNIRLVASVAVRNGAVYVGDIDVASQPLLGMVGSRRHSL